MKFHPKKRGLQKKKNKNYHTTNIKKETETILPSTLRHNFQEIEK